MKGRDVSHPESSYIFLTDLVVDKREEEKSETNEIWMKLWFLFLPTSSLLRRLVLSCSGIAVASAVFYVISLYPKHCRRPQYTMCIPSIPNFVCAAVYYVCSLYPNHGRRCSIPSRSSRLCRLARHGFAFSHVPASPRSAWLCRVSRLVLVPALQIHPCLAGSREKTKRRVRLTKHG